MEGVRRQFLYVLTQAFVIFVFVAVPTCSTGGNIPADKMLVVEFESDQYMGSESSGFVEVIIKMSGGLSAMPISVMVTTTGQSAGSHMDFDSTPFHIIIKANTTSGSAKVPVTCDTEVEETETFDITLKSTNNSSRVTIGAKNKSVGQISDSTVIVNFNKPSYEVIENDMAIVTIMLSQPLSKPFQVTVKTVNVTAFAGEDYIGGTRNISIPAGKSMVDFTVDTIESTMVGCDETFNILIISVTACGGIIGSNNNNSKVIIKDNTVAKVSINRLEYSIMENSGTLSGSIIIDKVASDDVTVEVTIGNGSANAKEDYANSTSLVFNVVISAGSTSSPFSIDIVNDMIQESIETFDIAIRLLKSCSSISLGTSSAKVMIIDDDDEVKIQFASASFNGSESSGEISVNILVTGAVSSNEINVMINLNEGTATNNDFSVAPIKVTIPAKATDATIKVKVENDNIVEGDEMFTMSLNVPSSLAPGIVAGSVTNATGIIIDSSKIRVRFTQTQYNGSEATGFVIVMLELVGGVSINPFNVTVTPSDELPVSAEGGVDFNTTTLTATFDSGMTMSSVNVPVMDDTIAGEGDETFYLILNVPSSLNPAITSDSRNNTATAVIIDTTMLVVEFESRQYIGSESSGSVEVVVIISGGSSAVPISVNVTIDDMRQTNNNDFDDTKPIAVAFAPKQVKAIVEIPVKCDSTSENDERFDISLTLTSNIPGVGTSVDTATGIIRTTIVNFKELSYEIMEGRDEVVIMIEVSQSSPKPFEVMISLMDDTAKNGEDYRRDTTSVTIPANKISTSVTINITEDDISECNELFKLMLSIPSSTCGVDSGNNNMAEVMISDDDMAVLSFNQSQYSIEENITPLSVGLMLSRRTSEDVIVEVTITDGSAKAGIDYGRISPLVHNVTITAGMTSSSFDVDIIDNMIQDGDKTFTIFIKLLANCFTLPLTIHSDNTVVTINDEEGIPYSPKF